MMKCGIVQDLLPLYCDNVCSEDTRQAVEEHLLSCPDCKKRLERMEEQSEPVKSLPSEDAKIRVLRGTKKRFSRQRRRAILTAVAVMAVLSLVVIGAADVERPVEYKDGLITGGLAVDEVIDLYYHGGNYSSFNGFSREMDGKNIVFLCFNQTLKSNALPPLGEGHTPATWGFMTRLWETMCGYLLWMKRSLKKNLSGPFCCGSARVHNRETRTKNRI